MLAVECIEIVIHLLPPKQRFRIAVDFRFTFIQKQCLAVLEFASIVYASRKGQCDLLDFYWHHQSTLGPLLYSQTAVNKAGTPTVLEWWKQKVGKCILTMGAMSFASCHGHVAVLDWWWKKEGGQHIYTGHWRSHIDFADVCRNGHVAVLQWWHDNDASFRSYDTLWHRGDELVAASEGGHVPVLEWCDETIDLFPPHSSPFAHHHLNTYINALQMASFNGHLNVLEWWGKRNTHRRLFTNLSRYRYAMAMCGDAIFAAVQKRDGPVVQWWNETYPYFESSARPSIEAASQHGNVALFVWWKQVCGKVPHKKIIIEIACRYGHTGILQWCKDDTHHGHLFYENGHLVTASEHGHVTVLEWWKNNGENQRKNKRRKKSSWAFWAAVKAASEHGRVRVLQWFKENSGPHAMVKYADNAIKVAQSRGCMAVVAWWLTEKNG